ncbi:hypothetical protein [Maribacter aurantiacus]|uniref:Uncharacterized protein n=1 Tax=Maribacter aurantiacus TaxID=1882343 RepID=A0A5R8M8D9_9FLAO|nr:hypothetical protein [Maribacter aurantiacus]TLF45029.1 hypothetical protein FEK29_09790 [Maribacter aurantiacus]
MERFLQYAKMKFKVDNRLILLYCLVYLVWGLGMNWFGTVMEIARFTYWWQVITCYILYMVPISLLLRNRPFHEQYAYGLIAMGFLEFGGYALQTSHAYPDNLLDKFFGGRTFALGMALFFALYFPAGNWLVGKIYDRKFPKTSQNR